MMILKTKEIKPFHKLDDNCIFGKNGDISFAFSLSLPEIYSLAADDYDNINSEVFRFFKMFSDGTVVHKQDFFLEEKYSNLLLPNNTFLQKSVFKRFINREYYSHLCFMYITYTNLPSIKRGYRNSSIIKTGQIFQADRLKLETFIKDVDRAVSVFNSSSYFKLKALCKQDIKEIVFKYLNGFSNNKLTDIQFKPEFKIGDNYLNIYAVNSTDNLPQSIPTCFKDDHFSSDKFCFYKGYLQPLGLDLNCNHVVNQIFYLDGHKELKKQLDKVNSSFKAFSKFTPSNKDYSKKIDEFVNYLNADEDMRLCRAHVNLMVWDNDKSNMRAIENMVVTNFKACDITPYHATYIDHIYYYLCCLPGSAGLLPRAETFDTDMLTAAKLFVPVTNYKSDDSGSLYTDRKFNIPVLVDDFFEPYETKRITSRNSAIITKTGGGKSVLLNRMLRQSIEMNMKVAGIDIGNSLETVFHLYPNTAHIQFKPDEPLGLNPFLVRSPSELTPDKIQMLVDFNFVLWKKDKTEEPHERTSMFKIVQQYYKSSPSILSFANFHGFVKETKDLLSTLDIEERFFDREEFVHVTSEYSTGMFKTLLEDNKQNSYLQDKQAICFELESIKDNLEILPLAFMLIRDVIDTVIFKNPADFKRIFMEELAKLIQYPIMKPVIAFYLQTIRKHDAGLTYVLQTVDQMPDDEFGNSTLTNTQIFHILQQDRGLDNLKRRLNLSDHSMNQIHSLQNDFTGKIKFTEEFLLMGDKGNVFRIELSPEEVEAYKSEKKDKLPLYKEFGKTGDMEQAIINILNK